MTYGHGDDAFRYGDKVKINFSTNIFQSADHSALLKHLCGLGDFFKNYPEPEPRSIEAMIALQAGIDEENVLVTNGATEAIYMLAHMAHGELSAIVSPTFREYEDACRMFDHDVAHVASIGEVPLKCCIAWLCNPNNPTGQVTDRDTLIRVIDSNPDTIFVVDQAYAHYTRKPVLTDSDAVARPNVVLLSSLTKQFAIPGLRIGYAVANPAIHSRLRALRMPWSVNSIAIEAARYLLEHKDEYDIDAAGLCFEARRIAEAFSRMGIKVMPTDCNFFLAELPASSAAALKDWLVEKYGILIRDASNFYGLGPRYFRVAAQGADDNGILINAVGEWMSL